MKKFEDLIKKDEYQVFVFSCPAYIPFNYFRHSWFILNKKGEILRYEVRHNLNKINSSYMYINNQYFFEGTEKSFFTNKKWDATLLGSIEGEVAMKIINNVENFKKEYLYYNRYSFFGPNCNTFIQSILNKFSEFNIRLSNRFIGKDFNV